MKNSLLDAWFSISLSLGDALSYSKLLRGMLKASYNDGRDSVFGKYGHDYRGVTFYLSDDKKITLSPNNSYEIGTLTYDQLYTDNDGKPTHLYFRKDFHVLDKGTVRSLEFNSLDEFSEWVISTNTNDCEFFINKKNILLIPAVYMGRTVDRLNYHYACQVVLTNHPDNMINDENESKMVGYLFLIDEWQRM